MTKTEKISFIVEKINCTDLNSIGLCNVLRGLGIKGENEVYIDNEMELMVLRLVNDWIKVGIDELKEQDESLLDFIILVLNSKI